jgi:hypothetical protein
VEVELHAFLNWTISGSDWSASRSDLSAPLDVVDPTAGLYVEAKTEILSLYIRNEYGDHGRKTFKCHVCVP